MPIVFGQCLYKKQSRQGNGGYQTCRESQVGKYDRGRRKVVLGESAWNFPRQTTHVD